MNEADERVVNELWEIYKRGRFATLVDKARKWGVNDERTRILSLVDQLIHDTEVCPLYEGEERDWLLSAYRNVRRVVAGGLEP